MSALNAVQKAIGDVIETVLPFHDGVPADAAFPYAELEAVDFNPDDADCIPGRAVAFLIKVWGDDETKLHPTAALVDQVYQALHEVQLTLDDPYAGTTTFVPVARVNRARDAVRAEGTITILVGVEDHG